MLTLIDDKLSRKYHKEWLCLNVSSSTTNLAFTSSSWKNDKHISIFYKNYTGGNYWSFGEWKRLPSTCALSSDSEYSGRLVFIQLARNILKVFLFQMITTIMFLQKIQTLILWSIMSFRLTNFLRYDTQRHFLLSAYFLILNYVCAILW